MRPPDARVAQAADDDITPPLLAVAHRDRPRRLPQIELAELTRAIQRALVDPRRGEQRPDLPEVVIQDRLAAPVTSLTDQLTNAGARHPRLRAQRTMDLLTEALELAHPRRAHIPRRRPGAQRPSDRLAMTPSTPVDLRDRQPLHETHPADLSPLLHTDHVLLLALLSWQDQGRPDRGDAPASQGGQFSTGAPWTVFNRRRQGGRSARFRVRHDTRC